MQYTQASLGRIFALRFDSGEDIISGLKDLIRKEKISSGVVHLMGALTNTEVVLGPAQKEYPPCPQWWNFDDAREILGLGIFAWENDEPKIHIHAGFGNSSEARLGCIRNKSEVYLTIEGVLYEFIDANISRKLDKRYNASLLNFE